MSDIDWRHAHGLSWALADSFASASDSDWTTDDIARAFAAGAKAALRAKASAWQPIETAPKDGTEVWAYNGEQARMKWIEGEGYALWEWADELLADVDPNPDQPTHWQPIPAPPEAA